MKSYTDRYLMPLVVKKIEPHEDGSAAITGDDGMTGGAPKAVAQRLHVGDPYAIETKGGPFGRISGWQVKGKWVTRKTDAELDQEHADMVAQHEREHRESLERNREDWIAREEKLPDWIKERIRVFHERGGTDFEVDGWGYELVICELAALYAGSECEDTAEIEKYANDQGVSSNQADCAKWLAREHAKGNSLAGTVAGLAPITGSAFYEPVG